jgi:hypothetical protein
MADFSQLGVGLIVGVNLTTSGVATIATENVVVT